MESPIYYLESVVKAKTEDLEDFRGPLDLILSLLKKNEMEIKDIQLSLILEQYLLWMSKRQAMDLEIASEFVIMASHLVDLKTRMLLSVRDTEATSEMEEFIAKLEEHQNRDTYLRIKKTTAQLMLQYRHGQNLFTKPPEILEKQEVFIYDHKPSDLSRAMHNIFSRMDGKKPVEVVAFQGIVGREPYPVAKKAVEIINYLRSQGSSGFTILIARCQSKSEAVATFIAVLDLCKNNKLFISEDEACVIHYLDQVEEHESSPSIPIGEEVPHGSREN